MGKKHITAKKTTRINIRLLPKEKAYIEQAARMCNTSVSSFIITSAIDSAGEAMQIHNREALSEKEWNALYASLIKPPKCPIALQKAFDEYRRLESGY